jgi:hypothetical protein
MKTISEPLANARASRSGRPGPPARLTVWLLYTLAASALVVTIALIAHSGATSCTDAASASADQYHGQSLTCPPAGRNPVPGRC